MVTVDEQNTHRALQSLPAAFTRLTEAIDRLSLGKPEEPKHLPIVVPRADGTWGAICPACTEAAGDYITDCPTPSVREWPPLVLHDHPQDLDKVRAALTACRAMLMDRPSSDPEYVFARRILTLLTGDAPGDQGGQ